MHKEMSWLAPYQFGNPEGVDPHYASMLAKDKRKVWSIRRRYDTIAQRCMQLAPGEEITRDKVLGMLTQNGKYEPTGADLVAATRFMKALNGSDLSLQALEDSIDGKLKEQIEHTVKPADLTNDERAERIQALMLAARQRSQPVIEHADAPNPDV